MRVKRKGTGSHQPAKVAITFRMKQESCDTLRNVAAIYGRAQGEVVDELLERFAHQLIEEAEEQLSALSVDE